MRAACAWILALALVPTALAQSPPAGHVLYCSRECQPHQVNTESPVDLPVNVILYAHLVDALQRAPLNVVPPDPSHEPDVNGGFLTPTVKVREDLVHFESNWFTLYHIPRFVQYPLNVTNQDGPLSYALKLGGPTAKLYWYLSPQAVPSLSGVQSPTGPVGVIPQLHVYARIDSGRHAFHGTLIAEGQTLAPALVNLPGQDYAYEFEVPLKVVAPEIPPENGFVVSVNWYQYDNGEEQIAQNDWRIRSGVRFAPRLILPVANPFQLSDSQSLYRSGIHFIATTVSPVFGAYDIWPFSLNMTFRDGPRRVADPSPVFHFYHPLKPQSVKILWAVPNEQGPLPAGTYTFEMSLTNFQQTYRYRTNVTLEILDFSEVKGETTPATGAAPLLAATAVLLALVRRRNN